MGAGRACPGATADDARFDAAAGFIPLPQSVMQSSSEFCIPDRRRKAVLHDREKQNV
jgi:hypothetical protein